MESFSTNLSISFVKQTFSDEIISPSQILSGEATSKPCEPSKLTINYQIYKAQSQSQFVTLIQNRRQMMLVSLLQFLSFDQVSKLSLTSKKMHKFIDPLYCQQHEQMLSNKEQSVTDKPNLAWSMHLKYIAAIQLLHDGYNLESSEIDRKFGVEIKQFSDLQYLNGKVFRDQLKRCLKIAPTNLHQDLNQFLQFSSDSIQSQSFTSVLDVYAKMSNPLPDRLDRIEIDYNSGGFFCLYDQNIVLSAKSYAADYQILIPSISSPKVYKQLCKLNNKRTQKEEQLEESLNSLQLFSQGTSSIDLEHIHGIGRIVQYQGMSESQQIWAVYEGEIQLGRAHGFGRAICGETKNNHIGYFEKGFKFGLGIELCPKGKQLNQGVFNNKSIVKKMMFDSFEENMDHEQIQQLDKEYWRNFLPFTGQTGYQLRIRDDLNFLDGFEDEIDVRDDDQFDMELQPETRPQ